MPEPTRTWRPLSLPTAAAPSPPMPAAIVAMPPPAARPAPERVLVTKAEAAEALAVSESIVDRLIRNGDLPAVRFEQRIVRVRVADLHAFAERRLVEAEPPHQNQNSG